MANKLSSANMADIAEAKAAFKAYNDHLNEVEAQSKEPSALEQFARNTVNDLPAIGGVIGGIVGTPADIVSGPAGTMVGAGIGGALGASAKNLINRYIDPDKAPRTNTEAIVNPLTEGANQASFGGVGEFAAPYVSKVAGKVTKPVSDYFSKIAENRAVAATGATGLQSTKFADDAGRQLLDRKIVGFGDTQAKIAEKAGAALKDSGEGIGNALKSLDESGAGIHPSEIVSKLRQRAADLGKDPANFGVSDGLNKMADRIEANAAAEHQAAESLSPKVQPNKTFSTVKPGDDFDFTAMDEAPKSKPVSRPMGSRAAGPSDNLDYVPTVKIKQMIKDNGVNPDTGYEIDLDEAKKVLARRGDSLSDSEIKAYEKSLVEKSKGLPSVENPVETSLASKIKLSDAENTKRGFQFDAKNKFGNRMDTSVAKEASDVYKQAVEEAALKADPKIARKFQEDKNAYSLLSPITDAAERRAATTSQSPPMGLLDSAASGVGAAMGGAPGAVVAPVVRRAIAPRLNSAMAVGSDALAKSIAVAPSGVARFAPAVTQATAPPVVENAAAKFIPRNGPMILSPATADNSSGNPSREPSDLKGEALWMQKGAQKLGIDPASITSKQAKQLLIEAADLPAGSKKLQAIKDKIQGLGK